MAPGGPGITGPGSGGPDAGGPGREGPDPGGPGPGDRRSGEPHAGPPDLAALGRELREAVGGEARAEAEEAERLAALKALRRRSLTDLARELSVRGDRVVVVLTGLTLAGVVVHTAGDLLGLATPGGRVDVRLPAVTEIRVVEPSRSDPPPSGPGPENFTARLFELEMAGQEVTLGVAGEEVAGRLAAVAADHLLVVDHDGVERAVARHAVTHVRVR